jgi:hypothetical protein
MNPIILALLVLAIVYGLERNRLRQHHLRSGLAGSVDAEDRDRSRVQAELRAARDRQGRLPARRSTSGPVSGWHRARTGTRKLARNSD